MLRPTYTPKGPAPRIPRDAASVDAASDDKNVVHACAPFPIPALSKAPTGRASTAKTRLRPAFNEGRPDQPKIQHGDD